MKKIIAVVSLVGLTCIVAAQAPPTKQLSIQEVNQLNGTPKEPTINGKPYSQYKAEQEALKKQQAAVATKVQPAGLNYVPNTQTTPDPAAQRMNEPVLYGVKPSEIKPEPQANPGATEQTFTGVNKQDGAAPQAVVLPGQEQWQGGISKPATELASTGSDPSAKQSKANVTPVEAAKGVVPGGLGGGLNSTTEQPVKIDAAVTKTQKPASTPEVPAQFRLPENSSWGNASAKEELPVRNNVAPSQVKNDPAQSMSAPASTEIYKTPQAQDANKGADKRTNSPAEVVPASVVSSKQQESKPAPEVPSQFRLPATQSWNGRAVSTEAPATQVTEKAAFRTAADAPKTPEVDANKVQKPGAEKNNNTTPVPAAAGASTGETSKVEASKKD